MHLRINIELKILTRAEIGKLFYWFLIRVNGFEISAIECSPLKKRLLKFGKTLKVIHL